MQKEQEEPDKISFKDTDFYDPKVVGRSPFSIRRSPIIVTLSHSNLTSVDVQKLMEAGMNVARFRTSQTTTGDKMRLLGKVDKAAAFLACKYGLSDWPCATCFELKTCITRIGILEGDSIIVSENSYVMLTNDVTKFDKCTKDLIFIDNKNMKDEIRIGMVISIAEDEIVLKSEEFISDKYLKCLVTKGGILEHNMCHVCFRGAKRSPPCLSVKDLQMMKFAMENQVDMLVVNYVRHPDTISKIKQFIGKRWKRPIIIGGICSPEGLVNIDGVLRECDGLVFSREFLSYEVEEHQMARMNLFQKYVTGKCIQAGKPMYISGGVFHDGLLTGMISDRDVSDVAHAILDGASGFILKECNNTDNTLNVIEQLNLLCAATEPFSNQKKDFRKLMRERKLPLNAAEAATMSCVIMANRTESRVIVLPTVTGHTVSMLLGFRPSCIVIAISTRTRTIRLLRIFRSVIPLLYKVSPQKSWRKTVQARVLFGIEYAIKKGWLVYRDTYVTLEKGTEESSYCDTVRLWTVAVSKKHMVECPESVDHIFSAMAPVEK